MSLNGSLKDLRPSFAFHEIYDTISLRHHFYLRQIAFINLRPGRFKGGLMVMKKNQNSKLFERLMGAMVSVNVTTVLVRHWV